jgi:hypothetical protein
MESKRNERKRVDIKTNHQISKTSDSYGLASVLLKQFVIGDKRRPVGGSHSEGDRTPGTALGRYLDAAFVLTITSFRRRRPPTFARLDLAVELAAYSLIARALMRFEPSMFLLTASNMGVK